MKKVNEIIRCRFKGILAFMTVFMMVALLSTQTISFWGSNGKAISGKLGHAVPSLAFLGIVAGFKKKGIELDEEERKSYEVIDELLKQGFEGMITKEQLNEKFNEVKSGMTDAQVTKLEELTETVTKQAVVLDQLKNQGMPGAGGTQMSLKDQIKAELSKKENKDMLEAFKQKQSGANLSFNIKAATTMQVSTTTAYTTAGTAIAMPSPEVIPGLNNVARNQPFILQLLNVMGTSKANIVYTEKYNPQGNAYEVGEGVAAPLVSFDIQVGDSRAKLVDAMIKVSVQAMDDIDYLAAEIEKELIYQVAIRIDTQLLQGDGTADNLKGIKSYAGGFTLTTLTTTNPNNCDAILAAATQITSANFRPDIAVLNPIDYANTKLLKGTTGYYIVNPNNEDNKWDTITVVQSNQVPVGYTMVMDSSRTNVFNYESFTISYGWVNDDFQKNLVSIMGKQRLHNFIKANDVLAFVYDSLANIKTAITAV